MRWGYAVNLSPRYDQKFQGSPNISWVSKLFSGIRTILSSERESALGEMDFHEGERRKV
jgi:hypothetical protein